MAHYTLTVYRADDTTPWFEVSTDPAHPHPYLHWPGEVSRGDVDLLNGKALVAETTVRIIDPQTGATQAERWLTERLGIPANEDGAGHSAVNGRRAVLERDDGALIIDGTVSGVTLSPSFAGFEFGIRDIRERHRKLALFSRTGTATVLPRGVRNGYGRLPNGGWLVPPTVPLRATFRRIMTVVGSAGYFDLSALWKGRPLSGSSDAIAPARLVATEAMRTACQSVSQAHDLGNGVIIHSIRYPNVEVWWRPISGDTSWRVLTDVAPTGVSPHGLLLNTAVGRLEGQTDTRVEAVHSIGASTFLGTLPSDGQTVDVMIVYVGPPTPQYPFHFEGTAGELLRNLYRGDYTRDPATGDPIPITTRVDEAALLALTTPIRLRLTEAPQAERSREWIESCYRALRAAPALDRQGRISPVTSALPPANETLPELTDANCRPVPGWSHPTSKAVTVVAVRYERDYRVPETADPLGERSAGDGIASIDVRVERRAPDWVIQLLGEQVHEIDGFLFRALGGVDGEPVTGDVLDETGAQVAQQAAREILDRWVFGGQVSSCLVSAAAVPNLRVGQWVIDKRSWRPNYRTGTRGGESLAQVVPIRELNPAWLEVGLIDAGPADQPVAAPTLGTLSVSAEGVVSIPVTAVPAGVEAAVYYAVSPTEPATDSELWTFLDRTATTGTLETPPLPAGARVWVRARGEALGRRPSAYTAAVSVTVPQTPRVQNVRVTVEAGTATVTWDRNAYAAGVRIRYEIHDPATDPTLGTSIDVAASLGTAQIPGTVHHGQAVTVEIEPWTGWTGSAVSGTAGPRIVASASRPAPAVPLPPTVALEPVSRDATKEVVRVVGTVGEGGTPPLEYRYRIDDVGALGTWSAWASLPNPVDLEIPHLKRWSRTVVAQVRDAGGRVSDVATYVVQAEIPGLGPGGGIDPLTPYDDGSGRTPADTDNDARAGRQADTDLSDFEAGGWLNRTQRRIEAIYRPGVGALSGADLVAGGDSLTRLGDRHAANIARSAADPTPLSLITQHLGNDGNAQASFRASDGISPKMLPKGVISGTVRNTQHVVFEQPYQSAPIVILVPSTSFDNRNVWGSLGQADGNDGRGSGNLAMPSPAQIIQRAVAVVTPSGFQAFCRLIARGSPNVEQSAFGSPTSLFAIGAASGVAPATTNVPSLDETYTAIFDVIIQNHHPSDFAFVDVQVAIEYAANGGAFVELTAPWFGASVDTGGIVEMFDQRVAVAVRGVTPSDGGDNFRIRLKDILIIGPSPADISVEVRAKRMEWYYDTAAKYASMTPNGDLDAVQFFVIAQG